ncbi:hypothetical protein PMAYCL1PPCAC_12797 [Pristionchus mayeri]|uniref:Uncharacterized protein n=1 Tax=Pristionchus mayeri TaxID=1317129 RepID=A0AAN5CFZ4_9BILA|nr:hypothetical protein PMAYCL1PPCAC_12797 [Pristionchus mayeri]
MSRSSSRLDPYSAQMREDQKNIVNGLLSIIWDNYDTTRKMQSTVDSMYKMVIFLVVCIVLLIALGLLVACYYGCRRHDPLPPPQSSPEATVAQRPRYHYQSERGVSSPLHQPRKSAPIEL